MLFRLGLPDTRADYVDAARSMGAPILLSASAFTRRWPEEDRARDLPHPGFRLTNRETILERLKGVDYALDSAGYVIQSHWGGYIWQIEQHVRLAGAYPWTWWAAPDVCCEPEVAANREEVWARIALTIGLYRRACDEADRQNVRHPMPVLQGYAWEDYLRCYERLAPPDDASIIGIGSMCRRHLKGENGLEQVLDRLGRELPKNMKVHLFGIKSTAMAAIAYTHPFVASVDSQAWGVSLRRNHPTGRTNAISVEYMRRFYETQTRHIGEATHASSQIMLSIPSAQSPYRGKSREYGKFAQLAMHAIEQTGHGPYLPDEIDALVKRYGTFSNFVSDRYAGDLLTAFPSLVTSADRELLETMPEPQAIAA